MSDNSISEAKKIIRTETGTVVSNKADKTATVNIERKIQHPLYKKYIKRSTKLKVHDAQNACKEGDFVRIKESKPHSKTKSWELVEIIKSTG